MIGKPKSQEICQELISSVKPNQAEIIILFEDQALTRFANNTIHQNVSELNVNFILRTIIGNRVGTAATNRLDKTSLDEVVSRSLANAQASPENPDYPGLSDPAVYPVVEAFDPKTAGYSAEQRANDVARVCKEAVAKKLNASGAFSTGTGEIVVANSNGVFAYHAFSQADFQTVMMGEDSSGRAHRTAWQVEEIPIETLGREAIQKAESGRDPQLIEAGEYCVVLDPYAVQDIVNSLNFYGMGAQSVLEGRSWMNDRLGLKVMTNTISLFDDGTNPEGMPMPFDFEGVPKQRIEIVKEGVVGSPVYDRFTANRAGKTSTGHALPPTFRGVGQIATNLFMSPGDSSLDEMIQSTERGLYITRFWYTRLVHPRDCVITGMTRDGVFLIKDGQLAHPVKNLRFTQSYVDALARVDAVGKETFLLSSSFGNIAARVPALKIDGFNFTGSTV